MADPSKHSPIDGSAQAGTCVMVRAWDLPTRMFHWLLVVLMVAAPLTRKFGGIELYWHKVNGYAILSLVVYRLLWGVVGGSTARFSSFVRWPWQAVRYGLALCRQRPDKYLGHNPLGGWMVLVLLAALLFQTTTGLFANDDALAEGPLAGLVGYDMSTRLTNLHRLGFDIILVLSALHIGASLYYRFRLNDDLITPMLTGLKPKRAFKDQGEAEFGSIARAVACLVLAVVLVLGTIRLVAGSLL